MIRIITVMIIVVKLMNSSSYINKVRYDTGAAEGFSAFRAMIMISKIMIIIVVLIVIVIDKGNNNNIVINNE